MAPAPWRIVRREEFPDVVCREIDDRPIHHASDEVVVTVQAAAIVVTGDAACAGRAFVPPHAEEQDHLAGGGDLISDIPTCRLDFHPIDAPAKRAIGRRIAPSNDIHPERRRWLGCRCYDLQRQPPGFGRPLDLLLNGLNVPHYQRALDQRVVRDKVDRARAIWGRECQEHLEYEGGPRPCYLYRRESLRPRDRRAAAYTRRACPPLWPTAWRPIRPRRADRARQQPRSSSILSPVGRRYVHERGCPRAAAFVSFNAPVIGDCRANPD